MILPAPTSCLRAVPELANESNGSDTSWFRVVENLASASNASFHETVVPLSLMTKLTYTATQGTYYNASEANASIPGWKRPVGFTDDPPAGMRALLFVEEGMARRGVVAFRGTDLGPGNSSDADRCADAILFDSPLPAFCDRFAPSVLDYWSAAIRFIGRVHAAFPATDLLFTGHSLGAGLALAAAVATAECAERRPRPAVAFAAPPWLRILDRHGVPTPPQHTADRSLYALADEWDPVQAEAEQERGLAGTVCKWSSPKTVACAACFGHSRVNSSALGCASCFRQRHVYSHYLHVDVPGDRPRCALQY